MNWIDWLVLVGTMVGIAAYGTWRTRHTRNLHTYLKGNANTGWLTIGLSVMATQASTITYLSLPGQAFESGIDFIQNYFGLPLALIVVCVVFLPIYRKLGVYTAYEYLGQRFDAKTRLLGAALFLLQRGLQAGITIYAPAIILSTVLGWRLDLTILFTGLVVVVYTVTGGSAAVNLTQKWQMGVIFVGMVTAFIILVCKLPPDATHIAGALGKLQGVDFTPDLKRRYTFWSGILGGFFLSLSYFGTDQSQVQRYIGGAALREGRLGLMFNAMFKIPMQFFIVLLGALLFVFYQFQPNTPVFFNQTEWQRHARGPQGAELRTLETRFAAVQAEKQERIRAWVAVRARGDATAESAARAAMMESHRTANDLRQQARSALLALDPTVKTKDSDYVFITFILTQLPHGLVGLLIAVMFASALSSKAGELNALGTTSTIDLWRHFRPLAVHDEARNVRNAKWFTALWGGFAIGFALFIGFAENLIEALNIVASIFYPSLLGVFCVAFFCKRVGGSAVFWAAIAAQLIVLIIFFAGKIFPHYEIGYLWLNPIGCAGCIVFSLIFQLAFGRRPPAIPRP
ncbi:MAG TPA: sodium:solute symporter [Verrucomicrobiota bacterium]|nr:sodium:solute symporter [Verrucomicrobiota bacterium]HNT15236.1 sodium:solute symporter [Verrucomicrobiota bacterium]